MQAEMRLHRLVLAILAILLAAFVAVLLYMHPILSNRYLEEVASMVLVMVAATAFVTLGMVEEVVAFQFGLKHRTELGSYFLLGLISLASGLYLAISDTASIQTVAVVASPYALFFGIGEIRASRNMSRHPLQRRGLFLCGLCELALGLSLGFGWTLSSPRAATLVGYTAILSVLQLVPFLLYKRQDAREDES